MLLYIIKVGTVREGEIKYAGLCKGFTNFLFEEVPS